MSCKSSIIMGIINFLISFILAISITNSFNFIATEGWTGLYNLLIGYPIYIIVFIAIMAFFLSLFCNIINYMSNDENFQKNKRHSYSKIKKSKKNKVLTTKTAMNTVKKKNNISFNTVSKTNFIPDEKKTILGDIGKNTLSFTGKTIMIILALFMSIIFIIKISIDVANSNYYEKTLLTHYTVNDYNNSKIIFYNKELQKSTYSFMHASKKYDIFKSFSEREMALQCIKISLNEYNKSNASKLTKNFKLNARNKYVNNKEMINRDKKNTKFIKRYFNYYRSYITQPIQHMLIKKKPNLCSNKVSIEKIYAQFIPQYIDSVTEQIELRKKTISSSNNPNYNKRKINNLISWLNELYKYYPQYQKKVYEEDKYNTYRKYNTYGYDDSL